MDRALPTTSRSPIACAVHSEGAVNEKRLRRNNTIRADKLRVSSYITVRPRNQPNMLNPSPSSCFNPQLFIVIFQTV